ncbi:MAG: glycosyltransferase family 39 protein, partial [Chloroflexota bacterium]
MKIRLFVAFILWEILALAVVGQFTLQKMWADGIWILATAVFLFTLILIYQSQLLRPPWFAAESLPALPSLAAMRPPYRLGLTVVTITAALLTYFSLADNQFTPLGFMAWLVTILCFILVFAQKPDWQIRRQPHYWVLLGILLIGFFYRFYRLNEVPVDFGSDQIEKLLDVYDVLMGERPLFFPRNTGREALQFYWTALLIRFTPLELNFTALIVGTGIFSVWTLFWVYLLGQELYGRQVGLLAALFTAMSHWHIAITRIGLRFVFTAAFLTPTLYFFIRAFRYNRRNDWLAAGAFLGIGLHTYIPMRMVPLVLVALTAVKLIFDWWQRYKPQTVEPFAESSAFCRHFWGNALVGGSTALLFFLPLLRYMADYPTMFWFRAASRLTTSGEPINYWQTFWDNSKNAWLMFNYQGDSVYANNLPHSPMLDEVTAALFLLGLVYLIWQLVRYRDRRSLYVLLTLAIMLLPSILSFAFTHENPSAVRTGGAIPVVMITAVLP